MLGNTWFWPPDRSMRIFSRIMSSRPLQRAIVRRTFFVERIIPGATARKLSDEEMDHRAFSSKRVLPRVREAFEDVEVVQLPNAKHYFQEDAPDEVVRAIRARFL